MKTFGFDLEKKKRKKKEGKDKSLVGTLAITPLLVNDPVFLNIHVWKKIMSYTNTLHRCFVWEITSNCHLKSTVEQL